MIMGGQAVLAYGMFRSTKDVDVTLGMGPDGIDEILDLAQECGWKVIPSNARRFVSETFVLPCVDPATHVRIIFSFSPFEAMAIARARTFNIDGIGVRNIGPEDLVIQKVIAGRPQDLDDAKWIVRKVAGLDLDEIRRWLRQFEDALNRPFTNTLDGLLQQ